MKKIIWGLVLLSFFNGHSQAVKPNVIIILADDLGYNDVGFNGCLDIPTSNIDAVATQGATLTNAYASYAVCGPSRAGIITGRYQDRFGFSRNPLLAPNDSEMGLPQSEETLSEALKKNNYTSIALGKWHLGAHTTHHPLKRGFDQFYGFLSGGHQYFPELWTLNDLSEIKKQFDGYKTKLLKNYERIDETEYLTDALSRETVRFINENSQKPFFIYLAYNAPHTPLQASEKYLKRFRHIKDKKRRTYAAMVSAIDDGVGDILHKLKEKGIEENTMVIFLSDNGGPEHHNASDNGELRGGKGDFFEGGIRVPFAIKWPAKIKPNTVYHQPVSTLDIFATATENANVTPKNKLDGINLIPYLNGTLSKPPHDILFWRNFDKPAAAVRQGKFKYVKIKKNKGLLFNVNSDLGEKKDIKEKDSVQFLKLKKAWFDWNEKMKSPSFLGLIHNKKYNELHPDRFHIDSDFLPSTNLPKPPKGYSLLWNDEFNNDGSIDGQKWTNEIGFVRNHELQWYKKENAYLKDQVLVLEARREKVKNIHYKRKSKSWKQQRKDAKYSSASVHTKDKFSFRYGVVEVRAKIDTSKGLWPAIWTLGIDKKWPSKGEIDLLEYYLYEDKPTVLANAAWSNSLLKPIWNSIKIPLQKFTDKDPKWGDKFHVWKMDWTEKYIKLYLDDVLLNSIDIRNTLNSDGFNPFKQPHYVLLNLAIGANGGNPSKTSFPRSYLIDYIRVYQQH